MRGLEASASLGREIEGRADLERVNELVVKRGRALSDARTAALLLLDGDAMTVVAVAGESVGKPSVPTFGRTPRLRPTSCGPVGPVDLTRGGSGLPRPESKRCPWCHRSASCQGVDLGVPLVFDRSTTPARSPRTMC